MAAKIYKHNVPFSRFIDAKGVSHSFGGTGNLITDDVALQAELDAAIKSGAQISVGIASVAPAVKMEPQREPTSDEVIAAAAAAAKAK